MSGFSKALAIKIYDATLNPARASMTAYANGYLSLHTSAPNDDTAGSEASFAGYARVNVTSAFESEFVGVAPEVTLRAKNSGQIAFPAKTGGADQTITHWAIFDAASGGTLLYSGAFATSRTMQDGDILVVQPGQLTIDFV